MTSPQLLAAEYQSEHSRGMYNLYGYMAIAAGLILLVVGGVQIFSKTEHPEYFSSRSCDEALLLDGQPHLGQPCSVLLGKLAYHNDSTSQFDFDLDVETSHARAFDHNLSSSEMTSVAFWTDSAQGQPVAVQVFKANGKYLVAKVYDAVDKKVRYASLVPRSRMGNAWYYAKIGLIILGIAAAWFAVAPFMEFLSVKK